MELYTYDVHLCVYSHSQRGLEGLGVLGILVPLGLMVLEGFRLQWCSRLLAILSFVSG